MRKIVLKAGLLAGAVMSIQLAVMVPLCASGRVSFDKSEVVGYTSMVLAFLMVFFAVRAYREELGGSITFGQALKVGLGVVLITSAMYVVTWQIVYYGFIPDFMEKYTAHVLARAKASGATEAALAAKQKEMVEFGEMYRNPLVNVGMTFLEIFPVGLVMALVSAGILRRRTPEASAAT